VLENNCQAAYRVLRAVAATPHGSVFFFYFRSLALGICLIGAVMSMSVFCIYVTQLRSTQLRCACVLLRVSIWNFHVWFFPRICAANCPSLLVSKVVVRAKFPAGLQRFRIYPAPKSRPHCSQGRASPRDYARH